MTKDTVMSEEKVPLVMKSNYKNTARPNVRKVNSSEQERKVVALWRIIFVTLSELPKKSATLGELRQILEHQGHKLGKYPLRTLSITVHHPAICQLFTVSKHDWEEDMDMLVQVAPGRGMRDLL